MRMLLAAGYFFKPRIDTDYQGFHGFFGGVDYPLCCGLTAQELIPNEHEQVICDLVG